MIKNKGKGQHIKVYVRVRPMNESEMRRGSDTIVDCIPNEKEIVVNEKPHDKITRKFTFDKVFGPLSKQVDVYKSVACPLIKEVLDGYNCTVFAYGQTGTGKTYTMEGGNVGSQSVTWNNESGAGIIPRALNHLFDELRILNAEFSVKASFLEIYNEELSDLLSPIDDAGKLRIFEDATKKGAVIVNGLEEVDVRNKEEVYAILARGSRKRQTAATLMNAVSSRSHTVFSVTVRLKENRVDEEVLRTGKLNLVDLAGSENIGRSGAVEKRAREAGNINQSLLTLGRVITALVEKTPHVPYRESKLTRLLQESLGGRTKTCIVATVSPSQCNVEETLSTLDYAHRAKNIQNKPEVNERIGKVALLQEYIEEIHKLKIQLSAAREKSGVWLPEENYNDMIAEIESQKKELSEMLGNMRTVTETLERKEELNKQLSECLERYLEDLNATKNILKETTEDRDEHAFLLEHRVKTEEELTKQAESLLSVADKATNETFLLHETLDRKRSIEENNLAVYTNVAKMCRQVLSGLRNTSLQFQKRSLKSNEDIKNILGRGCSLVEESAKKMKDSINCASIARNEIFGIIQGLNKSQTLLTRDTADTVMSESTQSSQDVFQTLACILTEIDHKLEVVSRTVDESQEETRTFMGDLSHKVEEQGKVLQEYVSKSSKCLNVMSEGMEKQENIVAELKVSTHNLKKKEDDLAKRINSACDMLNGIRDDANDFKVGVQNLVEPLNNACLPTSELKYLNSEVTCLKNTVETHEKGIQDFINGYERTISPFTNRIKSACSEVHDQIGGNLTNFAECQEKHLESLQEHMNSACNDATKFNHQLEGHIKGLYSYENEFRDSQENNVNHNVQEQLLIAEECKKHVDNCNTFLKSWNKIVVEETCECEKVYDRMVTKEIQIDVSSGRTPQRCEYNYPRNLTATSPHGRILSRFRTARIEPSQMACASSTSSLSQDNSLLSENNTEEQVEFRRRSYSEQTAGRAVPKLTSRSESSIPCAVLDKENSNSFSSPNATKLNITERRVLSEHNE